MQDKFNLIEVRIAAVAFLEKEYFTYYVDDLGLLCERAHMYGGKECWQYEPRTWDPAAWNHWLNAASLTLKQEIVSYDTMVSVLQGYRIMQQYVQDYADRLDSMELIELAKKLDDTQYDTFQSTNLWRDWLVFVDAMIHDKISIHRGLMSLNTIYPMITLYRFTMDNNCYFDVLIPEFPDKDNYFYQPTEKLHMFDLVTLIYRNNEKKWVIQEDNVEEIILSSHWASIRALEGTRVLPDHIPLGHVSLHSSFDVQYETSKFNDSNLYLWSSASSIQTWLYTRANKIYLEVSCTYPWSFVDPEPFENYFSFDEYVANYKPIAVHEINKETADQWIKQADALLKCMERPSG